MRVACAPCGNLRRILDSERHGA